MNEKTPAQRLKEVREFMRLQNIDAFIVPYADAFQSHNAPAAGADRLKWLTGFKGSAGCAIVEMERAAVFIDSRYKLSARGQIDESLFEIVDDISGRKPQDYPAQGSVVGYDAFLHTKAELDAFERAGCKLKRCAQNVIDQAWGDKALPQERAVAHQIAYAGKSVPDKISEVCFALQGKGIDGCVISAPDSVSWLLNLRVPELPVVPAVHGYVFLDVQQKHVCLYTDVDCSAPEIAASFEGHGQVYPLAKAQEHLPDMCARIANWQVDDNAAPAYFRQALQEAGAQVVHGMDPCVWPKACKNEVEQAGMVAAHIKDGVAMARLLHAIDTRTGLSERDVERLVYEMRAKDAACFTHSFEPIVGFNENGAYVHGQVPDEQIKTIEGDGLLLIDSGGQYLNGTTDVTRTLVLGKPSDAMRRAFTLVLRGHIALARTVFPVGTSGGQLDALARAPLWEGGHDYGHGTGHGVGYCLNVHEGPCNISPRVLRAAEPLKAGMVLSIEPGVYIEDGFGIRHENLYILKSAQEGFLRFEALTCAPFDRRGLLLGDMRDDEIEWLNSYHADVQQALSGLLEEDVAQWLIKMCAPL